MKKKLARLLVLTAIFFVAGSGILYELIIATVSTYFLGSSIQQFSVTIGFFMMGLGVGSYLSGKIKKRAAFRFIQLELLLCFLGGMSATICYWVYTYVVDSHFIIIPLIFLIGTLVGTELPLLIRLLKRNESLASALAYSFTADYFGALAASLAFPFLLLPVFGPIITSYIAGISNLFAIGVLVYVYEIRLSPLYKFFVILLFLLFVMAILHRKTIEMALERLYFQHRILYLHQSPYQRIIVSQYEEKEFHLYLDHRLQFSSLDEFRYHELLVHPVVLATSVRKGRALFIGAGDGLAVRELLKYDSLFREIIVVDIDSAVTHLAQAFFPLRKLNEGALFHPCVRIIHEDGFVFLERDRSLYDVIIIDLPDPEVPELARLYSQEFYQLISSHLLPGGGIVVQASSPYHNRKAYWCIVRTLGSVFPHVLPYWTIVPRFGIWGFVMARKKSINQAHIIADLKEIKIPLRYLDAEVFASGLHFPKDMDSLPGPVNTLFHPVLYQMY